MWRVHPYLRWLLAIAFGCLVAVGCSSDPAPATLPSGEATEVAATPAEAPADAAPTTVEEEETSVTSDQPLTLAELAAGYLYDNTETLEFRTLDGVNAPCVWHFVRDSEVIGPGVSIFELADGSLVADDPVRVINSCFFPDVDPASAIGMAGVLTTSGEFGGYELLPDETQASYTNSVGLTFEPPALIEDGDDWVLTFQALNPNDFSVLEVDARRSADGTFATNSTLHEK